MVSAGRGSLKEGATMSPRPAARSGASCWSTTRRTVGSKRATAEGLKCGWSSLRCRVWLGGSAVASTSSVDRRVFKVEVQAHPFDRSSDVAPIESSSSTLRDRLLVRGEEGETPRPAFRGRAVATTLACPTSGRRYNLAPRCQEVCGGCSGGPGWRWRRARTTRSPRSSPRRPASTPSGRAGSGSRPCRPCPTPTSSR